MTSPECRTTPIEHAAPEKGSLAHTGRECATNCGRELVTPRFLCSATFPSCPTHPNSRNLVIKLTMARVYRVYGPSTICYICAVLSRAREKQPGQDWTGGTYRNERQWTGTEHTACMTRPPCSTSYSVPLCLFASYSVKLCLYKQHCTIEPGQGSMSVLWKRVCVCSLCSL